MEIVFVAGPPRSGTTLVTGLLQDEKSYPMLPECTYLSRIIGLCQEIKTYPDKTRYASFIKDNESLYRIFQPSIKAMIHNVISDFEPKNTLVLKDPELSMILEALQPLISFPFKVVACIRDPRDVAASWLNVLKRKKCSYDFRKEISKLFGYYYGIMQAEDKMSDAILKVFRYEDLLKPLGAQELEVFTGCSVNVNNPYANKSFEFDKNDPFCSSNYGNKITFGSLRRFERDLTHSEICQIEEMFSGVMAWGGYE